MKKNIWIWNHYATNMIEDKAGRHYWLAENLRLNGYRPAIFCASTIHNSKEGIDTENKLFIEKKSGHIPFAVVKTPPYWNNGKKRIINMFSFYKNLFPAAKRYAKEKGKPDLILASSVHPLTLVAGIKIAKKFGIPCICEVRDLWPESLVAYGLMRGDSLIARLLYQGEKWIYKNADKVIFTMEGGKDYIRERKWDMQNGGPIDLAKVYHLNNGLDLDDFIKNREAFPLVDDDLDDDTFKVIYTGTISKVNDVGFLVDVAKALEEKEKKDIKFLIYGDGTDKVELIDRCNKENITNLIFKGRVPKHQIPYILSKSDLNFIHFQENSIKKYGASLNKLFEYFASGKPILTDCEFGYDLVNRYKCGSVIDKGSPDQVAKEIVRLKHLSKDEYEAICNNSIKAATDYDFKSLTEKFIELI